MSYAPDREPATEPEEEEEEEVQRVPKRGPWRHFQEFGTYLLGPVKEYFLDLKDDIDSLKRSLKELSAIIISLRQEVAVMSAKVEGLHALVATFREETVSRFNSTDQKNDDNRREIQSSTKDAVEKSADGLSKQIEAMDARIRDLTNAMLSRNSIK